KTNERLELVSFDRPVFPPIPNQTLNVLSHGQCLQDSDCGGDEECAPRACLMFCAADDPFCCGPSVCQPTAPSCEGKPCGADCTPPGWDAVKTCDGHAACIQTTPLLLCGHP